MTATVPPATATDYARPRRPAPVRLYNRLGALAPPSSLQLDELLAVAQQRTGASDFGDPAFRQPLSVLLAAMETEARLNPLAMSGGGRPEVVLGGALPTIARNKIASP